MTQKEIDKILYSKGYLLEDPSFVEYSTVAAKEIYKLYLKEKFEIITHFRTTLLSEGCADLADEYFEDVENLEKELKTLEE